MHKGVRVTGVVLLWALTVLEALGMGAPGLAKFFGPGGWQRMFVNWGYPVWFSYVIGAAEIVGAVGLLVPRTASWAALMLIPIMIGAAVTLLTRGGPGHWSTPAVHIILLSVILVARWKQKVALG